MSDIQPQCRCEICHAWTANMGWKVCDRCREIEEGSPPAIGDMLRAVGEMREKHLDLVWYARSNPLSRPGDENSRHTAEGWRRHFLEATYPQEVANLSELEVGADFHYGFHSGVLAGLRFVAAALTEGVEAAKAKFPDLNT
jgi:hypothetical protein